MVEATSLCAEDEHVCVMTSVRFGQSGSRSDPRPQNAYCLGVPAPSPNDPERSTETDRYNSTSLSAPHVV